MPIKDFLKSLYPLVDLITRLRSPSATKYWYTFFSVFLLTNAIGLSAYFYLLKDLPSPYSLSQIAPPLTTHIRDRNGVELYKIYKDQNRTLAKLSQTPLSLRQAIVAIEDSDFYHHPGFSITGIIRATWRVLTNQDVEGGSTITQQLVKTSLLSPEQTLRRKLRELVLSIAVEAIYSKDQILEMYLNRVSFGGDTYGVEEAAETYFGKPVSKLDLAESALLAGLPASPTTYSPYGAHPELAKSRQKEVLHQMVIDGYITWNQANSASSENLNFLPPPKLISKPPILSCTSKTFLLKNTARI